MTTPQDEANAAAERIQQLWRQYRDAVQQFEHASLPRVNSVATFGSATAGSTHGDDAMDDLAQYEAQLNEAAALVQRRWRQYRVEVVTASTEGLEIPQSSYGHAETRDANAPRWHEWSPETDLATARPPQHESHSQRGDDAASRIQRRWKRYREAVRQVEHSQHDQPNEFNIEAAAALIQRRWRQYFRAAREESEVPLRAPRDEDDDEDDEEPMRTQTTEEEDVSARASNHNPHDAARRIQRLWKRYREAVEQFEDAASTVESNAEDVATAAETIQRRWRQYVAARRRQHTPQRASVGRPARSSSSSSSTSSTEDAADNTAAHLPPPPVPAPPRLFVEGPRDAAALMIQFWWRRRDPSLTPTATDPDRGQRIREALQDAQAEWRGLVDQVRLRDRTEAAVRLQEAWRHHRTVTRYREELAAGRRDAAARSIQLAFRRRSGRGLSPAPLSKPTTASPSAGPRAVVASQSSLPTCIVCLDEVVQMALLPCGHAHLCAECAPALRRCPACRALVSVRIRIYL